MANNNNEVATIQNSIPQQSLSEEAKVSSDITNYTLDNSNMKGIDTIYAELNVSYEDPSVILTDSPELELVNSYFKSVTSGDTGIQILLLEVLGYSMAKTSKLNKAFILKR
ncbi:MAG: hypothetical protein FWC68_01540 [Oscillospiraceae bacterium]|nr:hypothetical protein [Oscillospiraceae bacterium]